MAFAAMGGGQPVGFSIGLTVGGVLVDSPAGWRAGFYVAAGINSLVLAMSVSGLPRDSARGKPLVQSTDQRRGLDWRAPFEHVAWHAFLTFLPPSQALLQASSSQSLSPSW